MLIIQLSGLSGSGKSTLAYTVQHMALQKKLRFEVVDADVYRTSVCKDLGFSKTDRYENLRRLGIIANNFSTQSGTTAVIIAAITPYEEIRLELKQKYSARIVWVKCSLPTLIKRDTKGLYERALLPGNHPNRIINFTGVSDVYEDPVHPDLTIETENEPVKTSAKKLFSFILAETECAGLQVADINLYR